MPTLEIEAMITEMDAAICASLAPLMQQLIPKDTPPASEAYISPLKAGPTIMKLLRCKLNVSGHRKVRCWDEAKKELPLPSEWTDYKIKPRICLRSLLLVDREIFPVLEVTDCQLSKVQNICPF